MLSEKIIPCDFINFKKSSKRI